MPKEVQEPPSLKYEDKDYVRRIIKTQINGEEVLEGVYERGDTILARSIVNSILAQQRQIAAE